MWNTFFDKLIVSEVGYKWNLSFSASKTKVKWCKVFINNGPIISYGGGGGGGGVAPKRNGFLDNKFFCKNLKKLTQPQISIKK
jgi:hypothetical protein